MWDQTLSFIIVAIAITTIIISYYYTFDYGFRKMRMKRLKKSVNDASYSNEMKLVVIDTLIQLDKKLGGNIPLMHVKIPGDESHILIALKYGWISVYFNYDIRVQYTYRDIDYYLPRKVCAGMRHFTSDFRIPYTDKDFDKKIIDCVILIISKEKKRKKKKIWRGPYGKTPYV